MCFHETALLALDAPYCVLPSGQRAFKLVLTSSVFSLSTYDHQTALQASFSSPVSGQDILHLLTKPDALLFNILDSQNRHYTVSCRDGLERIEVDAGGTIGTLRQQISSDLNMPRDNVTLSKDQKLVCIRICTHSIFNIFAHMLHLWRTANVQDP